jgi:tRNA pseudouridine32 synthase / 23S rRNA pseudouridine746 synthase
VTTAAALPINLLFEDAALLVLDKPSGMLSVPGRGEDKQDCLSGRVQALYPDALVVHRLDMATSGLMLMARGKDMQRVMSAAFASREIDKRYTAMVAGELVAPTEEWAVIDLPIAVDWPNRPLRIIDATLGKPSVTRWRVAQTSGLGAGLLTIGDAPATRLELAPVTGRSHQLRVHLAAIGHPILGDRLYAPAPVQMRASRLLLHACALSLRHPLSGLTMNFESLSSF